MPSNTELEWFAGRLGRHWQETETAVSEALLRRLFGPRLVQLGSWGSERSLWEGSPAAFRWLVDTRAADGVAALIDSRRLPLASDSVDVAILPHTLEYAVAPHALLREVDRVLVCEGHVLALNFNPWSWVGMRQALGSRFPWSGRRLSERRLRDWLAVLGLEVCGVRRYFYRPPIGNTTLLERSRFLERWGGVGLPLPHGGYALLARKRRLGAIRARPRVLPRPQALGDIVKPAVRGLHRRPASTHMKTKGT